MNSPQSGPASVSSGVLGARPPRAQTFHGSDPDLVASTAIEHSPTGMTGPHDTFRKWWIKVSMSCIVWSLIGGVVSGWRAL